ncbi:MAG: O-antigen ligase family protein [Clostridiaceae bacterium]
MNIIFNLLFILYLFVLPLMPRSIAEKFPVIDAVMFLMFLAYLIKEVLPSERRRYFFENIRNFFKDSIVISMTVLVAIMFISTSYAYSKSLSLNESLRFLTYIVLIFIIKNEFSINRKFDYLFNVIYIPSFFVSIFGIIQYFTGWEARVITDNVLRMESTLGHPNVLGAYVILLIFPLIMLTIKENRTNYKIFNIVLILLFLINLALSQSRNSWLAFVLGCIILSILYNWRFLLIIVGAGALSLLSPKILYRLSQFNSSRLNEGRINIWKTAVEMIKDHPILGIGNGNFTELYDTYVERFPQYRVPDHKGYPTHNSYLKMLTELGIPGIIAFMVMLFLVIKRVIYVYLNSDGKIKLFYTGLVASLVTFLVLNLFDNMLFAPKVTTYFWIFVAMIISFKNKKRFIE